MREPKVTPPSLVYTPSDLTSAFLKYDVTNLAYFLPDRKRAAIVGVGGGRDIVSAAVFGYRDITGVELNPGFVKLLTTNPGFADFTNIKKLDGVRLVVDEGRSWFARADEAFDVIQMSCGGGSGGARCLSLADYVRGPTASRAITAAAAC